MKAVIAAYGRSPFHFAKKGALAAVRPDTLAAQVVRGLMQRTGLDPALLEDVILGCAYPEAAQGNNLARIVALLAALPQSLPGMTVNRFCGSSMSAIHIAAANIEAGLGDAFMCIGVESMTMVPQGGFNFSPHPDLFEQTDTYIPMGRTAENVARQYRISRQDQEALALLSHQNASAARSEGRLQAEIIAVAGNDGTLIDSDGCIRPGTTAAALAALAPAFGAHGVVTAGTSSPLTDGAAAVLVTSDEFAARHHLPATARIRALASVGCDPALMGIGPIAATRRALQRAGLTVDDLDVVEINEAFASQALACIRELGLNPATINLDGGGMAIGHPLGATGARITGKAAALLARQHGRYALATQCIGGGQGIATILEAL